MHRSEHAGQEGGWAPASTAAQTLPRQLRMGQPAGCSPNIQGGQGSFVPARSSWAIFSPWLSGELSINFPKPALRSCLLKSSLASRSVLPSHPVHTCGPGPDRVGALILLSQRDRHSGHKEEGDWPKWFTGHYSLSPAIPRQYGNDSCSSLAEGGNRQSLNGPGPSVEAAELWGPPTEGDHFLAILIKLIKQAASAGAI